MGRGDTVRVTTDKILHFSCSLIIEILLILIFPLWLPFWRLLLNVVVICGGKELFDYLHSHNKSDTDYLDIITDGCGALGGELFWFVLTVA